MSFVVPLSEALHAYLQFVMHYSAIQSKAYSCPNSKYWKWIGV